MRSKTRLIERYLLAAAVAVSALFVSYGTMLNKAAYLIEDQNPERANATRWKHATWLAHENTLNPQSEWSVEGFRLTQTGGWSVSVGESVETFDRNLGVPFDVGPSGEANTLVVRYHLDVEHGVCSVKVDPESGVVTELSVYKGIPWSIMTPPIPRAPQEERETPGAWLSYYTKSSNVIDKPMGEATP